MWRHSPRIFALVIAASIATEAFGGAEFKALPGGMPNTYQLTTEDQLTETHRREIANYVRKRERTGSFKSDRGGAVIQYRIIAATNPQNAVVIVNGRTESMLIYDELIYDLNRLGYTVYIHDHRGQGLSGGRLRAAPERGYVANFDDYVADLEKFINERVLPAHHANLYLLAHSMGGAIATLYLEKDPNRTIFKAAALVTPMHEPLLPLKGHDLTKELCQAEDLVGRHLNQAGFVTGTPTYSKTKFSDNDLSHSKVRYESTQAIYDANGIRVQWPTRGWVREACEAGAAARAHANKIAI
ncbi:MAG TPA: alpha/beta fold hydrolase, partial [Thermoanaerobaculia bacterium]